MSTLEHTSFSTDDLALAAYLKTRGHTHASMEKQGRTCSWVYRETISLREALDEYFAGEAFVEPLEFMRKVGLLREELYRFMGVKPKRVKPNNGNK